MARIEFDDLPLEAKEALRDLDFQNAAMLAIDANIARQASNERAYPAEPMEALREAHKIALRDVPVAIDDPVGLALDVLAVSSCAMGNNNFTDHEQKALINVMFLAETALRAWRMQDDEVRARLRAITHPQK